jgi:hypothetical protein
MVLIYSKEYQKHIADVQLSLWHLVDKENNLVVVVVFLILLVTPRGCLIAIKWNMKDEIYLLAI